MSDDDRDNVKRGHSSSHISPVVYVCATIEITIVFGSSVSSVPIIRLIEGAICQRFYNVEAQVAEHLCKGDAVQSSMAHLLGVLFSVAAIPSLVFTIPYGILAEHVDRRYILLINFISFLSSVLYIVAICYSTTTDLRLIWLSGLFDIVGGGESVSRLLLRTIIAEAVPSSSLSTILYRLSGISTLVQLLGTALGSFLLENGAVSSMLVGQCIYGLIIPLLTFVPLTGSSPQKEGYQHCSPQEDDTPFLDPEKPTRPDSAQTIKQSIMSSLKPFRRLVLRSQAFKFCLLIMLFNTLFMKARALLNPWMSKRYAWSLSSTGYILSLESILGTTILFILQYLESRPSFRKYSASYKRARELKIAAISLGFGIVGSFWLGAAETRVGFLLGACILGCNTGFADSIKAYFTTIIGEAEDGDGKRDIGRLYSASMVVEYVVIICSAPMWSAVYSWGYSLGGIGMGVPFFSSGAVMAITLLLVLRVMWIESRKPVTDKRRGNGKEH